MPIAAGLCHRDGIRKFHLDGHTPPIRCLGDARACHLAFEAQVLCHIHPAELGNPDAMIPQFELVIGKIEARLASLLAFEPGTTFPFPVLQSCKERGKRFAQVEKGLV